MSAQTRLEALKLAVQTGRGEDDGAILRRARAFDAYLNDVTAKPVAPAPEVVQSETDEETPANRRRQRRK